MGTRVQKVRHLSDCWTWAQMMEICCFDLEIRVIMLPRNIKHADRHSFESHQSKSRRVWPCSASPWSQISLAKILDFEEPNSQLYFAAPLRPRTPVSGPAEARIWGTPTGYLLGKNNLGFAPRDKVVGLVASTVQDFYARLIGSAVQKF